MSSIVPFGVSHLVFVGIKPQHCRFFNLSYKKLFVVFRNHPAIYSQSLFANTAIANTNKVHSDSPPIDLFKRIPDQSWRHIKPGHLSRCVARVAWLLCM